MHIRSLMIILGAVVLLAAPPPATGQSRRADPLSEKLPKGEGREAVIEFCSGACHTSDRFMNVRRTKPEWRRTVLQMVASGGQLFPEDIDTVTQYLAEHYGPDEKK